MLPPTLPTHRPRRHLPPAGCLLAAPLTTRLGALRVVVWSSALNLAAWPALCFGSSVPVLVGGRLLSGMFVGLNVGNSRIYIAEVGNATRGADDDQGVWGCGGGVGLCNDRDCVFYGCH